MTLIPDLERDLLHAAGRASHRRRRRAGLVAVGGAAGAVTTAVLLLGGERRGRAAGASAAGRTGYPMRAGESAIGLGRVAPLRPAPSAVAYRRRLCTPG